MLYFLRVLSLGTRCWNLSRTFAIPSSPQQPRSLHLSHRASPALKGRPVHPSHLVYVVQHNRSGWWCISGPLRHYHFSRPLVLPVHGEVEGQFPVPAQSSLPAGRGECEESLGDEPSDGEVDEADGHGDNYPGDDLNAELGKLKKEAKDVLSFPEDLPSQTAATGDAAAVLGDVGGGGTPVLQRRGTDGRAR
jgi:hypothetical protein